ncbi:hypothetical protein O7C57_03985 [Providencia sp. 21OH12SH02B-Prov]|uniref:hypothetical protein n=1 Tax=unclassified Providencia TaxID=2633465 RepID=UPI0022B72EEE|nr:MULTISPECIES: hypothetical protein [unclassified Providencia]WBA57757.1 hypothetical protein O7C57_03985 [Providencia sp. 21OH12SH02B-Prov]
MPNVTQAFVDGLGGNENKKIGGYILNLPFTHIRLDGKDAKAKYWIPMRPEQSTLWNQETELKGNGGSLFTGTASYFSYGIDIAAAVPTPFIELDGVLIIQAYITDKQNLDLTTPQHLDGSSTIELYYY